MFVEPPWPGSGRESSRLVPWDALGALACGGLNGCLACGLLIQPWIQRRCRFFFQPVLEPLIPTRS